MVFFSFIEANTNLLNCYGKISEDSVKSMTQGQIDSACHKEKNEIKKILDSNEMTMSRVIKDRIGVLKDIAHV